MGDSVIPEWRRDLGTRPSCWVGLTAPLEAPEAERERGKHPSNARGHFEVGGSESYDVTLYPSTVTPERPAEDLVADVLRWHDSLKSGFSMRVQVRPDVALIEPVWRVSVGGSLGTPGSSTGTSRGRSAPWCGGGGARRVGEPVAMAGDGAVALSALRRAARREELWNCNREGWGGFGSGVRTTR